VGPPDDLTLDERDLLLEPGWPRLAFIERRMADDPTNWWLANAAAVEAMLRSCGLHVVDRPGHEMWAAERDQPFRHSAELDRATGQRRRGEVCQPATDDYEAFVLEHAAVILA
jgi:tRNA (mo5U34)-methyltransferase